MKIKNSDIERLIRTKSLDYLRDCRTIPSYIAFKLKRMAQILRPIMMAYQEQEQSLINKYGDRNKDGNLRTAGPNLFIFAPGRSVIFREEKDKLLEVESELPEIEKIQIIVGEDIPDRYLSSNDMEALECLIDLKWPEKEEGKGNEN